MKNKLVFCLVICALAVNFEAFGQSETLTDSSSYYVVIGAFKVEGHARTLVKRAKASNFTPISALNKNRNLYYVYVIRTSDRLAAIEEAIKIRKDTAYWDTWVYRGKPVSDGSGKLDIHPLANQTLTGPEDVKAGGTTTVANTDIASTAKAAPSTGLSLPTAEAVVEKGTTEKSTTQTVATEKVATASDSAVALRGAGVPEKVIPAEPGAKVFYFKVVAAEGQTRLIGKVDVIDIEKAKKAGTFAGNRSVSINPPNKTGNVSLVATVFTYQRKERQLNFYTPSDSGNVVITNDLITVPFELVRLKKGDFAVMYNVYFFKDAAVMRPESKYEINSLVSMMKENRKYKIRIHGHTNGNSAGKVVSLGDSKNFFSLNGTKDGYGSAKKLSEERAKMIRAYLVNEGIDQRRMEIKAWGGKKPVYDKMSPQAQANVRVEIEILEDK